MTHRRLLAAARAFLEQDNPYQTDAVLELVAAVKEEEQIAARGARTLPNDPGTTWDGDVPHIKFAAYCLPCGLADATKEAKLQAEGRRGICGTWGDLYRCPKRPLPGIVVRCKPVERSSPAEVLPGPSAVPHAASPAEPAPDDHAGGGAPALGYCDTSHVGVWPHRPGAFCRNWRPANEPIHETEQRHYMAGSRPSIAEPLRLPPNMHGSKA